MREVNSCSTITATRCKRVVETVYKYGNNDNATPKGRKQGSNNPICIKSPLFTLYMYCLIYCIFSIKHMGIVSFSVCRGDVKTR